MRTKKTKMDEENLRLALKMGFLFCKTGRTLEQAQEFLEETLLNASKSGGTN